MFISSVLRSIRAVVCVATAATCLFAADGSAITGHVRDGQGKAIANAHLKLFRVDTSASTDGSSNDAGVYQFGDLASGDYILSAAKDAFRTATINVRVDRGHTRSLDLTLDVAGVNQSVVVTAANAPQTLSEVSKALTVISHDEITNRNDYAFSELLRTTPGLQISNGGGPGQNTSVRTRGLRPDATAFLVDGLRFRDAATTQSDASSFISTMNVIDADHVEVLRGSGSSLYGTNAAGGAVNIVTDQGGGALHGSMQAEGGNLGLFRGRGNIAGGALGDKLKFSAGLLHLNVTSGVDGQDASRSTGAQGFVRYDFTPQVTVSGRVWASDDFAQLNNSPTTSGVPRTNFPLTGIIDAIPINAAARQVLLAGGRPNFGNATYVPSVNDPDSRRASRFVNTAFIFRQILGPRFTWQASYGRVHTRRVYENRPLGVGFQPSALSYGEYTGDIDTADVRGIGQITSWMNVTGGYEFEREHYFDHQDDNVPAPNRTVERTRARQSSHAAYFASQMAFFGRQLQVSLSGRAQVFRLSQPDFQYGGTQNPYAGLTLASPPHALTGDASLAYFTARSNTKFRAHVGNAFRAPSLYERFGAGFYNDPVTDQVIFSPYGDPRLAPDRYNSVDTGIDQYLLGNRLSVSATFFYTRIVQLTAFDFSGIINPATDPFGRSSGYLNGSGGHSRGAELALRARPTRTLSISGSYTYTNANTDRDVSIPGYFGALGVPKHVATAVATNEWTRRFTTTVDVYRYSSITSALSANFVSRAFRFPGFTKTGLVASYRFWDRENRSARMYARVDNVFDRTYYETGFLAPGATFVTGLSYSF